MGLKPPLNIVIVAEGTFGLVKKGDYDGYREEWKGLLEETFPTTRPGSSVLILSQTQDVIDFSQGNQLDIVIYFSRGALNNAQELAQELPNVLVLVFTGLIMENETKATQQSDIVPGEPVLIEKIGNPRVHLDWILSYTTP